MTQEQKGAVRTPEYGEAKALEIKRALRLSSHDLPCLARYARKIFEEGAEEARRVDAEVQEPLHQFFIGGYWVDCTASRYSKVRHCEKRILYARPANVAALEARVKVLKEALVIAVSGLEQVKDGERGGYNARNGKFVSLQMSDGERADIIHSDVTTECEGALETARAALTHEGWE